MPALAKPLPPLPALAGLPPAAGAPLAAGLPALAPEEPELAPVPALALAPPCSALLLFALLHAVTSASAYVGMANAAVREILFMPRELPEGARGGQQIYAPARGAFG